MGNNGYNNNNNKGNGYNNNNNKGNNNNNTILLQNNKNVNTNVTTTDCRALAKDAFASNGIATNYSHLAAGYRHYRMLAQEITKHKKKDVAWWSVRTEHLWNDMKYIDVALGGDGYFGTDLDQLTQTHGSERWKKEGNGDGDGMGNNNNSNSNSNSNVVMSDKSIIYVCCALRKEFQAYRDIVEYSANLNSTDKLETYQLSWDRCNVIDWEDLENRCNNISSSI